MNHIYFEWNTTKSKINIAKHGVSFDEAKTVFYDENARVVADPDHSKDEERFLILGLSDRLRLLVVSHCYRESEETLRIISARKATRNEANNYGDY